MSRNAITYRRVSTGRQVEEGQSLDVQADAIREYCRLHSYHVVRHYCDEGKSGRTTKGRDQFRRAVDHACRCEAVLIAYKLDRLGRSVVDLCKMLKQLKEHNCDVAFVMDGISTTGAAGTLTFQIFTCFAEYTSAVISEHITAANRRTVQQLGYRTMGQQPFGFELDEDHVRHIRADEWPTVETIFQMHRQGCSGYRIAKHLNRIDAPTKNMCRGLVDKSRWTTRTINAIVRRAREYEPYLGS